MLSIRKINPMVRAIGTMGVVAGLVGAVTFADLTSNTVVLADSQFSTQTASLRIWDGSNYTSTAPGFNFSDLALGTPSSEFTFWLENDGTAPLTVSGLATVGTYSGFAVGGFDSVIVGIRDITTSSSTYTYTLNQLIDGTPDALPGNPLAPGNTQNQYGVTVQVNPAAVSGSQASVSNFDWSFTGTNP